MASTCNGTSLSLIMRVYFFFLSSIDLPLVRSLYARNMMLRPGVAPTMIPTKIFSMKKAPTNRKTTKKHREQYKIRDTRTNDFILRKVSPISKKKKTNSNYCKRYQIVWLYLRTSISFWTCLSRNACLYSWTVTNKWISDAYKKNES